MEQTTAFPRPRALDAATVAEAFRITADERPDAVALRTQGGASEPYHAGAARAAFQMGVGRVPAGGRVAFHFRVV